VRPNITPSTFSCGISVTTESTTLFAGDSGNDLEVLVSPIPSVLVANGHPEVREQALRLAAENGQAAQLYCARGGWSGMNGNYSAGILEGIAHFRPDLAPLAGCGRRDLRISERRPEARDTGVPMPNPP
jgi:hypothetical protein